MFDSVILLVSLFARFSVRLSIIIDTLQKFTKYPFENKWSQMCPLINTQTYQRLCYRTSVQYDYISESI